MNKAAERQDSKIIIPDLGPTEDQIEYRRTVAAHVLPQVVRAITVPGDWSPDEVAKSIAQMTVKVTDALIEELEG